MPRGDGTGPAGFGPMTGRAAGYCAGYPVPGYMNPVGFRRAGFWRRPWLGWGAGFGRGRGWRRMYHATGLPGWMRSGYPGWAAPAYQSGIAPPYPAFYGAPFYGASYAGQNPEEAAKAAAEQETAFLKEQAEFLKGELKAVEERLKDLTGPEKDKAEEDK
ncbi:MAG: DUF5320 domain-containing protein [Bacillota bacterium]